MSTAINNNMDDGFDPYHKWLGIRTTETPPHHYRLLGLGLFESDPEVIQNAADKQMAHLKTVATGCHSTLSQKLLTEVSVARVCLLNPEKKEQYDQELETTFLAVAPGTDTAKCLACPHCDRAVANDPVLGGSTVACPHCGNVFRMPPAVKAGWAEWDEPRPELDSAGGMRPERSGGARRHLRWRCDPTPLFEGMTV